MWGRRVLVAVAFAMVMVVGGRSAGAAGGDKVNEDAFKCGPIDCDVCKEHPEKRFDGYNGEDLNKIGENREKFWENYPNGKDYKEARERFAQSLFEKDLWALQAYLATSIGTPPARPLDRGNDMPAKAAEFWVKLIDDGIPLTARYEFWVWAESVRDTLGDAKEGRNALGGFTAGAGPLLPRFQKASNLSGKQYQAYVMERDWGEFLKAKKIPAGFDNKERYGVYLYMRRANMAYTDATAALEGMKDALGAKVVEDAAEWVRKQPKKENGDLTVTIPPPLKKGPTGDMVDDYDAAYPDSIEGVYRDPLVAFQEAAVHDDAHRYILFQITKLYHSQRARGIIKETNNKWTWAKNQYTGLEKAFGGREKLQFAEEGVWKAKKRLVSGSVIGEKALGATRQMPWEVFEDMLCRKYPEGYAKMAIACGKDFEYPARVDMDKEFHALANRAENSLLEAAERLAAKKPNLFTPYELGTLKQEFLDPTEDEPKVAGAMVDYPEYWTWKGFPTGAQVMYAQRYWTNNGQDMVAGIVRMRHGYTLKELTPEQVNLWFSERVIDAGGAVHPPRDTEMAYPPKIAADAPRGAWAMKNGKRELEALSLRTTLRAAPSEMKAGEETSGEEVLEIAGRKLDTKWKSVTYTFDGGVYKDGKSTVKVWWSDAIPGKLVRRVEDTLIPPMVRKMYWSRAVDETWLESVKGFEPGEKGSGKDTEYKPVAMEIPGLKKWEQPVPPVVKPVPLPTGPDGRPLPAPAPRPEPGAQTEQQKLLERYRTASARASTAMSQITRGTRGPKLPENVKKAKDAYYAEIQDLSKALGKNDMDELGKAVKSLEDTADELEGCAKESGVTDTRRR